MKNIWKVLKHAIVMHESLFFKMGDNEEIHDILNDVFTTFILSSLVVDAMQQNAWRNSLSSNQRRNRSARFCRATVKAYDHSPFMQLYNSGHDDAMIIMTGVNYEAFEKLHDLFKDTFLAHTPHVESGSSIRLKKTKQVRHAASPLVVLLDLC